MIAPENTREGRREVSALTFRLVARDQESIYSRRGSASREQESTGDYHRRSCGRYKGTEAEDFLMRLSAPTTNTLWLDLHFIHF